MVGSGDDALRTRVQELEDRVAHLTGQLEALLQDARHTHLTGTAARTAPPGVHEPRFQAALDTVYQARTFGYVALYFVGGRTARMRLLVGSQNPPTSSFGRGNEYVSGVVRPGEFWMAATPRPGMKAGFECVFTPLF